MFFSEFVVRFAKKWIETQSYWVDWFNDWLDDKMFISNWIENTHHQILGYRIFMNEKSENWQKYSFHESPSTFSNIFWRSEVAENFGKTFEMVSYCLKMSQMIKRLQIKIYRKDNHFVFSGMYTIMHLELFFYKYVWRCL